MNKSRILFLVMWLLSLFGPVFVPNAGAAEPDVIKQYSVTVTPRSDGTLDMVYVFDYCATTDFPSGSAYLDVGVANSSFELVDYNPRDWVTNAYAKTDGGSWVHLEFAHLPLAGECFTFDFTIHQSAMAHLSGEEVAFQFTPGWFDFARIEALRITWAEPNDTSFVKSLDPQPTSVAEGKAVWETTNLAPNQKFTVNLVVAKSAFPDLNTEAAAQPVPAEGGGGGDMLLVLCVVIAVILVVIVLVAVLMSESSGSYSSGESIGGYHGGGIYTGGSSGSRSTGSSSGGRTSGGGGSYSGRGSSCACVHSCACACACAGGGRAGCSRKGFDVRRFLKRTRGGRRGRGWKFKTERGA